MAIEWYYLKDDEQQGPVSSQELKNLAAKGVIKASDLVWKDGMADWAPASKLKGLEFPGAKPAEAASPKPAQPASSAKQAAQPTAARKVAAQPAATQPQAARAAQPASGLTPISPGGGLTPLQQPSGSLTPLSQDDPFADALAYQDAAPYQAPQTQSSAPFMAGGPSLGMAQPRKPRAFHKRFSTLKWALMLMVGCVLMSLSFVVPWWGATFSRPTEAEEKQIRDKFIAEAGGDEMAAARLAMDEATEMRRESQDIEGWVNDHVGKEKGEKFEEKINKLERGQSATLLIWGWETGSGIAGLIVGLVFLLIVIIMLAVAPLERWAWITHFTAIIPGVVMVVLFCTWFFDAPDSNFMSVLSMGLIAGPYMILVGGLLLFAGGLTGGITGVIALARGGRVSRGY